MSMTEYILKTKWMHMLIPLVVLALYFIVFSWFLSWLLPEYVVNVNAVFVSSVGKYLLLLTVGLYLIFFILFKVKRGNKLTFENSIEKLYVGDFILILLPLTTIVQYILNNQDILSPLGSLYVFAVFLFFSILFIIILPILIGIITSTKTLMLLGLAFTFVITNMAVLSIEFHWLEQGNLIIQLGFLIAIFLISWALYNLVGRKVLYLIVVICFLTNSAIHLLPADLTPDEGTKSSLLNSTKNKLAQLIGSTPSPHSTPNIYLLIYDAYVINETMLQYGIDNSAQEKYLEKLGFKLYPHTY